MKITITETEANEIVRAHFDSMLCRNDVQVDIVPNNPIAEFVAAKAAAPAPTPTPAVIEQEISLMDIVTLAREAAIYRPADHSSFSRQVAAIKAVRKYASDRGLKIWLADAKRFVINVLNIN